MRFNSQNKIYKQNGFSIVESVIAITILISAGLMLSYFSTHRYSQLVSKEYTDCQQHASNTLNKIRSLGLAKSVARLDLQGNRIIKAAGVESELRFIGPNDDWLSDEETLWSQTPGGKATFKSYKALIGSMSLLNSLYSSNPLYCSSATGFTYDVETPAALLESEDFSSLTHLSASLRIQPYDLKTGEVLPCANPMVIVPSSLGSLVASSAGMTVLAPGERPDRGFLVTIFTQYEDQNGLNKSCSASANYSYPSISVNPNTLDDLNVFIARSSNPDPSTIVYRDDFSPCTAGVPIIQVSISTSIADYNTKKAMVMMCRSESTFSLDQTESCVGEPAITNSFPASQDWVPCHLLEVCGKRADNFATSQTGNGYILNYSNINMGCDMLVVARLMDAAQNIAVNATDTSLASPTRKYCDQVCSAPYQNQLPAHGFCSGGGRTAANSCDLIPVPPPTVPKKGGGDGGGDGSPDGGDSDGKGGDGGNKG